MKRRVSTEETRSSRDSYCIPSKHGDIWNAMEDKRIARLNQETVNQTDDRAVWHGISCVVPKGSSDCLDKEIC